MRRVKVFIRSTSSFTMQLVRVNTIPVTNCAYLMRRHKLKYDQIHDLDDSLLAHYCKFLNATGKKAKDGAQCC